MALRIIWSLEANEQLREAVRYLRKDNPEAAQRFGNEVRAAARSLRELPERGRIVPELGLPNVRELLLTAWRYRLMYRIQPDRIEIVILFHTSRDPDQIRL